MHLSYPVLTNAFLHTLLWELLYHYHKTEKRSVHVINAMYERSNILTLSNCSCVVIWDAIPVTMLDTPVP